MYLRTVIPIIFLLGMGELLSNEQKIFSSISDQYLYEKSNQASPKIILIPKFSVLEIINEQDRHLSENEDKEWIKVKFAKSKGWVYIKKNNKIENVLSNEQFSFYDGNIKDRFEFYLGLQKLINPFVSYCQINFLSTEKFKSGDGDEIFFENYQLDINRELDIFAFSSHYDIYVYHIISISKVGEDFHISFVPYYNGPVQQIMVPAMMRNSTITWKSADHKKKQIYFKLSYKQILDVSQHCELPVNSRIRDFLR